MPLSFPALKRCVSGLSLAVAGTLGLSGTALALSSYGPTCANCHGDVRGDALEVSDFDGIADPDGGIGALKFVNALRGSSVRLTANVVDGGPSYGVGLIDTEFNPDLFLVQGPGSNWTFEGTHFTVGPLSDNAAHSFDLLIPEDTPTGFYAFTFTAAGQGPSDFWAHSERFYVQVVPEAGTLLMLSAGLGVIGFIARRRRRAPA